MSCFIKGGGEVIITEFFYNSCNQKELKILKGGCNCGIWINLDDKFGIFFFKEENT